MSASYRHFAEVEALPAGEYRERQLAHWEGSVALGEACHRLFESEARRHGISKDEAAWDQLRPGWRERREWGA